MCRRLGEAAHLILALQPPHGPAPSPAALASGAVHSPARREVQRLSASVAPDADLAAALAGLAAAPARVRGHYLLAILQWGMATLRSKAAAAAAAAPAEGPGLRGESQGAGKGAESAGKSGSKRTWATRAGAAEDGEAAARGAAPGVPPPAEQEPLPPQQDARLWWLLAALLECEGLPAQEVQAPALLKPLLAACLAAPLPDQRTKGGHRKP